LASEYGWAKTEIEDKVYLDELYYLVKRINKRKLVEYKMQLAIVQNPHVKDPKDLWRLLESEEREPVAEKLDKAGFVMFKKKLTNSANIVVKQSNIDK